MKLPMKTAAVLAVLILILVSPVMYSYADYTRVSESVNLRESPSTDSRVLKLVPMGYEVVTHGESGGWTKATFEGVSGYIKSEYIEIIRGQPPSGNNDRQGGTAQAAPTPAPTPAPTRTEPAGNGGGQSSEFTALRFNSEGEDVRELQKLLTEKGFYEGPINGRFGPLTEEAVMKYQADQGLEMDGVVGSETMKKLTEKPRPPGTFRQGDEGDEVKALQKTLKDRKYYSGPLNGRFGPLTEEAVIKFQKANGLEADGVVGRATLELLNAPPKNTGSSSGSGSSGSGGSGTARVAPNGVELIDWKDVINIIGIGRTAQVYDVRSGAVYNVKSFSNGRHADVEPVTVEDTETLKRTFGGTWSWTPRPVWVTVNGRTIAGAINGMPHGGGVNHNNGMDGQICLHFKGSATHNNNHSYTQTLQDAVNEAWVAARK